MQDHPIEISFCTTCSNRAYQLQQTIVSNSRLILDDSSLEWVIVNFGSKDDLDLFMQAQLPGLSKRVVYARELSGRSWHLSIAKNVAHRVASGKILVSLDCDNFIGDAAEVVRQYFSAGCKLLHMWSGINRDGTCGRIAIDRDLYHQLGGYDESFHPMGYQDRDLLCRASASGTPVIQYQCDGTLAIRNTKEECIRYCKQEGLSWEDYDRLNRAKSAENIAAGRCTANGQAGIMPLQVKLFNGLLDDK